MSRAFVNEDDHREMPIVPPRADLPAGFPNYVTPAGMEALQKEREQLIAERDAYSDSETHEKPMEVNVLNLRLQMLEDRLSSAQVVQPSETRPDKVHFGAVVELEVTGQSKNKKFQIVGVDEADLKKGKIAFTSPIARLLMNKKVGESVVLNPGKGERIFKIVAID
ncbi:transcription elongation factor GreB [Lentimicrobium sp.]